MNGNLKGGTVMKVLYLVLLLAGNLFSQTTSGVWVTQDDIDSSWVMNVETLTVVGDATSVEFQDCKGDDLMFNYISGQIQEVDRMSFVDRQASMYLIQAPEVLEAYQWMRKNRGNKYSIHQMVVRVNRWYEGG